MTPHTFRKAAKVVLFVLTAYAVLHWGDRFGLLEADAWIDLRRDEELLGVLMIGMVVLAFVFGDELKLTNNVDANGNAIENDGRAIRAGNRSPVILIGAMVVGKLLFEIIVFFCGGNHG